MHSQIVATDEQLAHLQQQSKNTKFSNKEGKQPVASSTPQSRGHFQQQWLQQAELDIADAFLDKLDEMPAKDCEALAVQSEKQSKAA